MSIKADKMPPIVYARVAGFLYLIIIVSGIFAEVGVRGKLFVSGDASATATGILESQWLFSLGFIADSFMLLSDVAVAVLLYLLLKPVSTVLSLMAAAFRLTQAAVIGFNLLLFHAAILALTGEAYQQVLTSEQRASLAHLFLDMHSHGYDLGLLFFGVSSLLVGTLVSRSEYLPRSIGYGLIAAGIVYLAGSFTRFVAPRYLPILEPVYVIPLIAELAFCLWLLFRGVRPKVSDERVR